MKAYIESEDVAMVEEAAACLRNRLLIRLLFHLACRISEALNLEVTDIDLANSALSIIRLKQRVMLSCPQCQASLSKSNTYCPGCGDKLGQTVKEKFEQRRRRILPIDVKTLAMLKDYIERGGPVSRSGRLLLFGINRHRAWQIVKDCAERAGLPKLINPETGKLHNVSPHRLRDAFAVHAIKHDDSGDGLRMLQEHLGHASFNTTARYRKVAGEEHRRWYENLWREEKGSS